MRLVPAHVPRGGHPRAAARGPRGRGEPRHLPRLPVAAHGPPAGTAPHGRGSAPGTPGGARAPARRPGRAAGADRAGDRVLPRAGGAERRRGGARPRAPALPTSAGSSGPLSTRRNATPPARSGRGRGASGTGAGSGGHRRVSFSTRSVTSKGLAIQPAAPISSAAALAIQAYLAFQDSE